MNTNRRDFLKTLIVPFSLAATVACTPAEESKLIAESFMESYYVDLDVKKAGSFTTGLAQQKIQKQEKLMDGVAPDTPSQKPHVTFKFLKKEMGTDEATYYFRVETSQKILGNNEIMVRVRKFPKDQGGWKVSNFSESGTE